MPSIRTRLSAWSGDWYYTSLTVWCAHTGTCRPPFLSIAVTCFSTLLHVLWRTVGISHGGHVYSLRLCILYRSTLSCHAGHDFRKSIPLNKGQYSLVLWASNSIIHYLVRFLLRVIADHGGLANWMLCKLSVASAMPFGESNGLLAVWACFYCMTVLLLCRRPDKSEIEEPTSPCPYCSSDVEVMRLDCPECKNVLPYCIFTVSVAKSLAMYSKAGPCLPLKNVSPFWHSMRPMGGLDWEGRVQAIGNHTVSVVYDSSCPSCSHTTSENLLVRSNDTVALYSLFSPDLFLLGVCPLWLL